MSTQHYAPAYNAATARPAADGTITYIDEHGDTVQTSNSNVFNGLRLAGGEAFLPSDSESDSESEVSHIPSAHYGRTDRERSSSSSPSRKEKKAKKEKKEKKSKKSKKERSPEYMTSAQSSSDAHGCKCGHVHH